MKPTKQELAKIIFDWFDAKEPHDYVSGDPSQQWDECESTCLDGEWPLVELAEHILEKLE